ncbi:DEAD/DEAH box helicase [Pendulispora brunnea]|uniref:DEAD/DEAH box helicase n=1 Tax=Pendulispora brunnea TaxID=2905690 RepID=A0ABZ2KCJ0_9BACT
MNFVPAVRLHAETVMVTRTEGLGTSYEEVTMPLITLTFHYDTGAARDIAAETRCRHALERLGAVDLACVDDVAPPVDCNADFIVRMDGDAHSYCAFTAQALPKLRALGFRVTVDEKYPFQVVDTHAPWFLSINSAGEELPDWFSLELGVEVDGKRVDLLPMVIELIERANGEEGGLPALEKTFPSLVSMQVSETHHVTVSRERLRALLHVVIELWQDSLHGGFTFPRARATALVPLDEQFRSEGTRISWRDPEHVADRAFALAARPKKVEKPALLKATLRSYQEEGLAFLQHLRANGVGGVLADDMGLGKTLQTISHICKEKEEGRITSPILIVAPTSLVGNWNNEIKKFAPHLRVTLFRGPGRHALWDEIPTSDVVVTTYPVLVRDEERFEQLQFHMVVLDEAQAIKNVTSLAHKAIKKVNAEHKLCLTGTPVENHLGELWALFHFLNPELLGNEASFRTRYRQPIEQLKDEDRLESLRELVAPYILRRMKREAARELPQKTEMMRLIHLSGNQRELYEQIRVAAHADVRKVIKQKGLAASAVPIFGALLRLRQVCCDPRLVQMNAARSVRTSAKYDSFFELLEGLLEGGHRVLVFSQFTSMLSLLAKGLEEREIEHLILTGATQDRQAKVDAFEQGLADVFLISLKAGGTGLNLVSADTVIHYDPWWNPAVQLQATDRAYRIGQQRPVFVYNLAVAGSVEERVMMMQHRKRRVSSMLLGDEEQSAGLTADDVETLLAPLQDDDRPAVSRVASHKPGAGASPVAASA